MPSNSLPQTLTDREIDALVAEKVMGWTWQTHWGPEEMRSLFPPPNSDMGYHPDVPEFSTDISAAFQVLASKPVGEWCPSLHMQDSGEWYCEIKLGYNTSYRKAVGASASTLAMAICLTALQAVGAEIPA